MYLSKIASNNHLNQNFQAQQGLINYKSIKNIPNLPCACCGKKVLIPEQISKVFAKVEKPLSTILKLGILDFAKKDFPEIWALLQNFSQKDSSASFEKITNDEQNFKLMEAAIKNTRIDDEGNIINRFKNIMHTARGALRSSGVVIRGFAPLKKYLDGTKLETFEQLEVYSRKYPRKTISEILSLPEIYEFHRVKDLLQRTETKEKVDYRFENIHNMVKKSNPQAIEHFDNLKDEAMDIFAAIMDPQIRMIKIKNLYKQALETHNCQHLTKRVMAEIDSMPTTFITKDSFLIYAHNHNYNDGQILTSIFGPITSTFEHIIPRSKDGKNSIKNGLAMHKSCNQHRGNLTYNEFFEFHPEMPKNIERQIRYIAKQILQGNLDEEFRLWPISIAKTLEDYTNGAIKIDLTSYCEKGLAETEKRIEKRTENISQLRIDRDSKIKEKQELKRQIEALETEINNLGENVKELNIENHFEWNLIQSFKAHIKKRTKPE